MVPCEDPKVGMFCTICKKWGRPPPSVKGGWITRGIVDWSHATDLQKQRRGSKWHQDSSITTRMAKHVEEEEDETAWIDLLVVEKDNSSLD